MNDGGGNMAQTLTVVRQEKDFPADSELARAERELADHEAAIAAELARLDTAAGSLLGRLQQLRAAASQPHLSQSPDRAVVELARRVQLAGVPQLQVDEVRRVAAEARRAAIEARARAAEELRQRVQGHAAQLSLLASQLTADEAEVARYDQRARERVQAEWAEAERARQLAAKPLPPPPAPAPAAQAPAPAKRPEAGRRQSPRVRMQAAIDLSSDTNFFTGFSTNISEGGLFVATVTPVEIGTPVDLSFTLPGGGKISV